MGKSRAQNFHDRDNLFGYLHEVVGFILLYNLIMFFNNLVIIFKVYYFVKRLKSNGNGIQK